MPQEGSTCCAASLHIPTHGYDGKAQPSKSAQAQNVVFASVAFRSASCDQVARDRQQQARILTSGSTLSSCACFSKVLDSSAPCCAYLACARAASPDQHQHAAHKTTEKHALPAARQLPSKFPPGLHTAPRHCAPSLGQGATRRPPRHTAHQQRRKQRHCKETA